VNIILFFAIITQVIIILQLYNKHINTGEILSDVYMVPLSGMF